MKKISLLTSVVLFSCCLFCACSSGNTENSASSHTNVSVVEERVSESKSVDEPDFEIYTRILETDHIELSDALDQLSSAGVLSGDADKLYKKICQLKNCSERFIYESEDSGNRYVADVAFYLSKGEVYCSIDYTGYMGTIADGVVADSQQTGYMFESFTKGDYYGREQDFRIYFSNDQLYISWTTLGDKVCEYTLTRGDGSADSVQESHQSFEETGTLDTIRGVIDDAFPDNPHNVIYDEISMSVIVSVQFDGVRSAFAKNDPEFLERWQNLVDSLTEFGKKLYSAASLPTYSEGGFSFPYVMYVDIYIVDSLNSSGKYEKDEMLLWVENESVKYNLADQNNNPATLNPDKNNKSNSDKSNHVVTGGELNALESAKDYLSFMAFSYSGLVKQLEYEGYSTSEAEYAADNCGADWNQQAAKKAKEYLDFMSFSREGLIEQLEYEGFTHSQAVYGVDKVY